MSRKYASTFIVAVASILLGVAISQYGSAFFAQESTAAAATPKESVSAAGSDEARRTHLETAATEIIAAANEGAVNVPPERAMQRIELSIEALRLMGLLGVPDADAKASKLLDDLQTKVDQPVADAIVQIRLARKLRQWPRMDATEREKAIDRFIADVKASGPQPTHAEFVIRISEILSDADSGELAARITSELAPVFRTAKEPQLQRVAGIMDGIARRLTLLGKPLELEGTLIDGKKLDWNSFRGKVVLVDFWNSGCSNCRAEAPNVLANYQAYRDKGFEVISVNLDEDPTLAKMYMEQTGFNSFPTLFSADPQATGWEHPMAQRYGVTKLPVVFLVDQDGIVVNTMAQGPILGAHLRELLGEPSAAGGATGNDSQTNTDSGLRRVAPASAIDDGGQPVQASAELPASNSP